MDLDAVFLDRDGVINRERADYVKSVDELEILPGALQALSQLARLHCPIIVVTNQSCVGRGIISRAELDGIHEWLNEAVAASGGRIDHYQVCPHHPQAGCDCRKPQPGLLLEAAQRYRLRLQHCVFIGDAITDYEAARGAGCDSILVRSGRQGAELDRLLGEDADTPIVADLAAASNLLVA